MAITAEAAALKAGTWQTGVWSGLLWSIDLTQINAERAGALSVEWPASKAGRRATP
jgi:hypothetical protein